ncbi:MAG: hypothetical protein AAFV37_02180 [Pseudomonadota bacterium]
MRDLRSVAPEQRQRLADAAEQQARAGEPPAEICKRLGVTLRTYRVWAKQRGFRKKDLLDAGSVSEVSQAAAATAHQAEDPVGILAAVRAALACGDQAAADRLIADWKREARRTRDVSALEAAVAAARLAAEPTLLDDVTLAIEVSNLIKRQVSVRK